ncbi:Kinesin light chain [Seminavis robusta]|uniref:Kinesin light chain n=1 Tax=Seminavis robusta TaxID=568900 RepID=A0A9N8HM14_9STRA|nr:Kinesin light chain [Seminavis robusta]|eukprot:Sro1075_g238390.1 Kinesin light chain (398) ;mRNA; f:6995-8334
METLGVSVFYLEQVFLEEVEAASHATTGTPLSKDSKVYDIEDLRDPPGVIRNKGADTVCPVDGKMGAAYIHCLEQGEYHVGEATQMLSYSWDYMIGDIVDTLTDFCLQNNLNPKRTYIWICCLCVNQHRVVQNTTQQKSGMISDSTQLDFFAIFGERVKKIGHLLAMMAPWKAPIYITRVWRIFEMFTARTVEGCKVDIVMPPKERQYLEQDVINDGQGIDALYEALGNTQVQNAKSSVESDRLAILNKVESDVGFQALNNEVNNLLRGWMQGAHRSVRITEKPQTVTAICSVLNEMGDYEDALTKHKEALAIRLSALAKSSNAHYNKLVLSEQYGDHEGALAKHKEALAIQLSALSKNHPDVATTYNGIGVVLESMSDYDSALASTRKLLPFNCQC